MLRVRVIATNGASHYLSLPPHLDPVVAADILTGGTGAGAEWRPGPWLDTVGGGRIRADVIAQVRVEDDEPRMRTKSRGRGKRAVAIAVTGLVGGIGGVPVHVAQGMIDSAMQGSGSSGAPPILLVQKEGQFRKDDRPADEGNRDLIAHLRASLAADVDSRASAIEIVQQLGPIFGLTADDVAADPESSVDAIEAQILAAGPNTVLWGLASGSTEQNVG
jgi:hypothetical protein